MDYKKLLMVVLFCCLITGCRDIVTISETTCKVEPSRDGNGGYPFFSSLHDESTSKEIGLDSSENTLHDAYINLGNDNQRLHICYREVDNCITDVGIDQNDDNDIAKNESYPAKIHKHAFLNQALDIYLSFAYPLENRSVDFYSEVCDVPVLVRYRKSNGTKIWRKLYFDFYFTVSLPRGKAYFYQNKTVSAKYTVKTCFWGETRITYKKKLQDVTFALFDTNNNAMFNDPYDLFWYAQKNKQRQPWTDLITIRALLKHASPEVKIDMFAYPETIIVRPRDSKETAPEEYEPKEEELK